MADAPVRVLIADDHPIFRAGLRRLLEDEPDFHVVGEACNGQEALTLVKDLSPDVLLLDVAMPELTGLDVLRHLVRGGPRVRTVLLTASVDSDDMIGAFRLGAVGVLLKTTATELLFKCLRAVMAGQYWVGREMVRDLVQALSHVDKRIVGDQRPDLDLTPRERDVVRALVRGATNKELARQFRVTEQTVKNHLSSIFAKLGVSNRLELVIYAQRQGLGAKPIQK